MRVCSLKFRGFAISLTGLNRADPRLLRTTWLLPAIQLMLAAVLAPVAAWWFGAPAAFGLLAGGASVALGHALFAWRTAGGGLVLSAGSGLARLIVGLILKWLVIGAALVWALRSEHFEPASVLAGAILATLVIPFCLSWLRR